MVVRDGYISDENFYPNLDKIPAICPAKRPMDIDYKNYRSKDRCSNPAKI
nr:MULTISPECIES: hypothetical protein [Methanosarcina]